MRNEIPALTNHNYEKKWIFNQFLATSQLFIFSFIDLTQQNHDDGSFFQQEK